MNLNNSCKYWNILHKGEIEKDTETAHCYNCINTNNNVDALCFIDSALITLLMNLSTESIKVLLM